MLNNQIRMTMLAPRVALTTMMTWLIASPAFAHHPMGGMTPETFSQGLLSGIGHPIIGLDHFAFLVVAALLAFTMKSKAKYLLPLLFIGATVGGTLIHLAETNLPLAEIVVALTVVGGAVMSIMKRDISAITLGALFMVAGVFHGYAYGEAIIGAETTPILSYLAGFSLIQYGMIVGGVLLLEKVAKRSVVVQEMAMKVSGAVALLTGGVFLVAGIA